MRIGKYDIFTFNAGNFRLDGGAMFGVVPRVLWGKRKAPDSQNRIDMCANILLIRGEGRNILVDTGIGDKFNEKFQTIYAVDVSENNVSNGLAKFGLSHEDITDVILTHLHFDHAGGATVRDENGEIRPTFPNAKYYVSRRQFDWAMHPSQKDRASFLPEDFVPLQASGQLELLDECCEVFPGIELLIADGHTVGQQMVLIRDDAHSLFYAADLLPTAAHVPVPWVMAYDLFPLTTIEEKKLYLQQAVDYNWRVFFEHDPEVHCATIQRTEKGFAPGEVFDLR